jgi:hypothetical protein
MESSPAVALGVLLGMSSSSAASPRSQRWCQRPLNRNPIPGSRGRSDPHQLFRFVEAGASQSKSGGHSLIASKQQDIVEALKIRFVSIPEGLREEVESINDPSKRTGLHRAVIRCADIESFADEL